jgi:hypothetical protein
MDPFQEARAVALMHLPCPPLPVLGNMSEDGANAILDSHDLMSTFLISAFKRQDSQSNLTRRLKQSQLDDDLRTKLNCHFAAGSECDFDSLYKDLADFTRQYLQSYHDRDMDIRVLSADYISPRIKHHIADYLKAQCILNGEEPILGLDPDESNAETLLHECMTRVLKRQQGIIRTPVFVADDDTEEK